MSYETYDQAAQKLIDGLETSGAVLNNELKIKLATALFLGGIAQELGDIRANGEEIVSQLNTINAWLHGNIDGRPEVIVHRAEDVLGGGDIPVEPWDGL